MISHGTYLLWLDCGVVTGDSGALARQIRAQAGLCLSPGNVYRGNGARFLRMNLACPRSRMLDGLQRLRDGIRRNG